MFRHGLVVNAASPALPDLVSFLETAQLIAREGASTVRRMEEGGIASGTAVLEMNLLSAEALSDALRQRILQVVTPLLQSKEGEFNFILSDQMTALDLEYEPDQLFREGGLAPNRILGGTEGEKLKPLRGLEESLKAGKALLRGATSEQISAGLDLGLGQAPQPVPTEPPAAEREESDNIVPFPRVAEAQPDFAPLDEPPFPETPEGGPETAAPEAPRPAPARRRAGGSGGQFRVAGGLFEIESPDATYRNVVLLERSPLVRVAAKRAFTRMGVKIAQFGALEDVRAAINELFGSNSFFVTFLELTDDDSSVRLMLQLKRKNPRLPVVMLDRETDLRRRHDLLRAGADLYVTKPSPARLQPGLAEEELALFADELVLFAERSFTQWERMTGGGVEAGRKFYEMASKETIDRSFQVLRQLINELSNPNDIGEVSATILRLSAEYLDRGALFVARDEEFAGLGGFGASGSSEEIDARIRALRLRRDEPSVLADVVTGGEAHRGKMRRTPANVRLVEAMGTLLPTEVVALPIMHGGRTIGILYGDNAGQRAPIESVTGLEIFLAQAGYAFGNAVFASERAGRQ